MRQLEKPNSISTILDSQAVDEKYSQTLESQSVDKQQTQAQKSHREQLELESTFDKSPNSNGNAHFLSWRDTAPAVAWQSNSAPAESNQINGARKACNLESVQGDWGVKGGIRGDASQVAPLSPLEKTLSQAKLESSNNAQRVDSSVDCHAAKAARNDRKHTQNLESTFSMDSACGARIVDCVARAALTIAKYAPLHALAKQGIPLAVGDVSLVKPQF